MSSENFFQRIDARSKIIAVIAALFISAFSRSGPFWLHAGNAAVAVSLFAVSGASRRFNIKRFGMFSFLLLFAAGYFIVYGFFLSWSGDISHPLRAMTYLISSIICGVAFGGFLAGTTKTLEIAEALSRLKFPPRAVWMIHLALRYIPLLKDELLRTAAAARLRGFRFRKGRIRDIGNITAALTVRAYERALRVGDAMELRAYRMSSIPASIMRLKISDVAFAFTLPAFFFILRLMWI